MTKFETSAPKIDPHSPHICHNLELFEFYLETAAKNVIYYAVMFQGVIAVIPQCPSCESP